jgi:hypothetical protein
MTPISFVGLLLVLGIRHYTLKRATRQGGPTPGNRTPEDTEAQIPADGPVSDAEAAAPVASGEAQPLDVEKAAEAGVSARHNV